MSREGSLLKDQKNFYHLKISQRTVSKEALKNNMLQERHFDQIFQFKFFVLFFFVL